MSADPSPRQVRLSGCALGLVLLALGALKLSQHRPSAPYLVAAGLLVAFAAALAPAVVRPFVHLLVLVGEKVVWALSRAALVLVYYLVVTPVGVIGRLLGARFSDVDFERKQPSYWVRKEARPRTGDEHGKQF